MMLLGKAAVGGDRGWLQLRKAFAAMDRFPEELARFGSLVAGAGLRSGSARGGEQGRSSETLS